MPRSVKRFSIAKGVDENTSDPDTQGVGFRLLKNCLVDERLGALLPRRGSLTETLTGGLGIPLGMGEHLAEASTSLIPVTRSLLANFAGSTFFKFQSGTWSSVPLDANTAFNAVKPTIFDQIGENLYIAGGVPAFWDGGSNDIERVGIPPPATAPTLGSSGTGLTGSFKYVYTFRNSVSGLESDRSPEATITVTDDQIDLTALETTTAAAGVDEKRIYRTQNGGSIFFLTGTTTLAATTFTEPASSRSSSPFLKKRSASGVIKSSPFAGKLEELIKISQLAPSLESKNVSKVICGPGPTLLTEINESLKSVSKVVT